MNDPHPNGSLFPPAMAHERPPSGRRLRVAGLFAGIGGVELGFKESGHQAKLLCEIDEPAAAVLESRFDAEVVRDVRDIEQLPEVDLVAAGFPCQDLSQAGRTRGIKGPRSGLVGEVFRLMDAREDIDWLLLENVPFMLHLERGAGMRFLIESLAAEGFAWAYRIVDTRAFGLPQRRRRVLLLASRKYDPRPVLFADNAEEAVWKPKDPNYFGFYWTEGRRGLGWAEESVPTLKCGSTIGVPSPPAVWDRETGLVGKIRLNDAERLQGFPVDWTVPGLQVKGARKGDRWRMVGNAVSVPVAAWVGRRLLGARYLRRPLRQASRRPTVANRRMGKLGGDLERQRAH